MKGGFTERKHETDDGSTGSNRLEAVSRPRTQPAAQRLPIVEVKADMGFVVDVQTRSGAWCTFP